MKSAKLFIAFLLLTSGLFFSCEDQVTTTYTYRTMMPIYLEMSDVRARLITTEPAKPLDNPGKIYIYQDYLLVNEPSKGIHILDNSNPANPINLSFIPIEGNVDLAVNDNILYADNYVDLLAFDISKISNIKLINRVKDVFTHMYRHDTGQIITFKDTVITTENPRWEMGGFWPMRSDMSFTGNLSAASKSYGTGGSMARFTLMDGHLFAVDESTMRVFDVQNAADPKFIKPIESERIY